MCDNVGNVGDVVTSAFAEALGDDVTGEVAGISDCEPGCAIRRVLLGPTSRSLQDTGGGNASGTTTFVLLFSGPGVGDLSDTQVLTLIKDGEEIIEATLIGGGIKADIDFDGLTVVGPPVEAPSGAPYYSTKKNGKKGKKDKKGGKSAKK